MWSELLVRLFLAALTIPIGSADATSGRMLLPIEVLGADGTMVSLTVNLTAAQCESVKSLWLQVHGLRYQTQASVQVNTSSWIPLRNDTLSVAEPGRTFGGIGGGFSTLELLVPLPSGTVVAGSNIVRFRFNESDGLASGYRVLAWNFVTNDGGKVLPPTDFVQDAPESWTPPLTDADSIHAGQELWHTASLVASGVQNSPRIQAHCADCHARNGFDLKYFHYRPLAFPWPYYPAGRTDRQLHPQPGASQSGSTVESALPTWTRTRRTANLELGGRRWTRLDPRPGYGCFGISACRAWNALERGNLSRKRS